MSKASYLYRHPRERFEPQNRAMHNREMRKAIFSHVETFGKDYEGDDEEEDGNGMELARYSPLGKVWFKDFSDFPSKRLW